MSLIGNPYLRVCSTCLSTINQSDSKQLFGELFITTVNLKKIRIVNFFIIYIFHCSRPSELFVVSFVGLSVSLLFGCLCYSPPLQDNDQGGILFTEQFIGWYASFKLPTWSDSRSNFELQSRLAGHSRAMCLLCNQKSCLPAVGYA